MPFAVLAALLGLMAIQDASAAAQQEPPQPATVVEELQARASRTQIPITEDEYVAISPKRWMAPQFSPEQMASFVCEVGSRPRIGALSRAAYSATESFERVKLDFREGKASIEALNAAGDARETAVRNFLTEYAPFFLTPLETDKADIGVVVSDFGRDRAPIDDNGVVIQSTRVELVNRGGEKLALVTVYFANLSNHPARPKNISISALDRANYVLADDFFEIDNGRLAPGQVARAVFEFRNAPFYTHDVEVRFGRSGFPRGARSCSTERRYLSSPLHVALMGEAGGRILDRSPTVSPIIVEALSGERKREADGGHLVVAATVRNNSSKAMPRPEATVLLLDEKGATIGRAVLPGSTVMLAPRRSVALEVEATGIEAVGTGEGADPLALMNRISLVFNPPS